MKALNTLRNLIFLFFFAAAAASASAADGTVKPCKAARKQVAHNAVKAQRKEVAPFVDPTLPLTELVERVRIEHAH